LLKSKKQLLRIRRKFFASAFLSPPDLWVKAAKADYGEKQIRRKWLKVNIKIVTLQQ